MDSTHEHIKSKGFRDLACALRDAIEDSGCVVKKSDVDLEEVDCKLLCGRLEEYGFEYKGNSVPNEGVKEALRSLVLYSKEKGLSKKLLSEDLMLNPSLCGHFVNALEHKGWEYQE